MKKNFFKFTVSAVTASLILLAAGCSNVLTTATVSGSDDSAEKNAGLHSVNLHITASANDGVMKLPAAPSASSRNIHGDTLTSSGLKFYLFTKKKGTPTFDSVVGTVAVYSPTTTTVGENPGVETGEGSITLNLEDSYYDLCLLAVKTGNTDGFSETSTYSDIVKVATLKGETSADLREANATVHFYMIPDGLGGTSNVSIDLCTTGWNPAGFDVKASIVDYADGTIVTGTESNIASLPMEKDENVEFSASNITPGTYTFQVSFTQKDIANPRVFYYSESIDILPSHDIVAARAIPEIVLRAPTAPSNLYVGFKDPVNNTSDTYYAAFNWEDNSNNETYFQLEILTIPDNGAPAADALTTKPWGKEGAVDKVNEPGCYAYESLKITSDDLVASQIKTLKDDFVGNESQMWYKGSLLKNNKAVAVKLELGKRYLARICAVNDAGSSAYAYVDLTGSLNADLMSKLVGTGESGKYNKFDNTAQSINRYRLAYNLMEGTLTYKDGKTATGILYEYRTQNSKANDGEGTYENSSGVAVKAGTYKKASITSNADVPTADIMNPTCDTTDITSLVKGEKTWKYWKWNDPNGLATSTTKWPAKTIENVTGDMYYSPEDYTDYKNLILEACYSTDSASVTINQHDIPNIDYSSILVACNPTEALTDSYVATKQSFQIDTGKLAAGTVDFTVGFTDLQKKLNLKYDSVTVSVSKTSGPVVKTFPMKYDSDSKTWKASYGMSDLAQNKYAIKFEAKIASDASDKYSGVYETTIYMEIIEK